MSLRTRSGYNRNVRTSALLRAEQFARVAEVLGPCELVNGEIVPLSLGGFCQSKITGRAVFLLESHNRVHRLGRVLAGEAGFIVHRGPDTVRGADVAFISYRRLPKDTQTTGFLELPAELIIEVLSDDVSWSEMETKIRRVPHLRRRPGLGARFPQRVTARVRGGAPRPCSFVTPTSRAPIRLCPGSPAASRTSSPTSSQRDTPARDVSCGAERPAGRPLEGRMAGWIDHQADLTFARCVESGRPCVGLRSPTVDSSAPAPSRPWTTRRRRCRWT